MSNTRNTAVTIPQAIRRYRMGPVSVDSMVTSRWNRTAVAGLELAKPLPRGNDGWWAEYSTRNLKNQHIVFTFQIDRRRPGQWLTCLNSDGYRGNVSDTAGWRLSLVSWVALAVEAVSCEPCSHPPAFGNCSGRDAPQEKMALKSAANCGKPESTLPF